MKSSARRTQHHSLMRNDWSTTYGREYNDCHYENRRGKIDFILRHRGGIAEVQRISKLVRRAQRNDGGRISCGIQVRVGNRPEIIGPGDDMDSHGT